MRFSYYLGFSCTDTPLVVLQRDLGLGYSWVSRFFSALGPGLGFLTLGKTEIFLHYRFIQGRFNLEYHKIRTRFKF